MERARGKVCNRKKRISFQSRTQRKSFVVHHTSLWEGKRDRQQERVFEKNEKKKIEWEKRTKKQTHIFKETLGQGR